jgi:hypothetical protein
MPFNQALFWFGLTAFGTGLYFLFEASVKRLYSIGVTVLGVLACAYTVYRDSHPESPAIHLWVILLVLTWALLGCNIYFRRFHPSKEVVGISADERKRVMRAGVLYSKAGHADWLGSELERIWHLYHNDNDKLIYPLGELSIPEVVKEFRDKQLFAFRVQYRGHIGGLKSNEPDFHSDIMDAPYPWSVPYLDLMRKLREHAGLLRTLARSLEVSSHVDAKPDVQLKEIQQQIPSILVNGIPVDGPAKFATDKGGRRSCIETA